MEVGREWKLAIEVFQTLKYLDPDFCVIFYFPLNYSSKSKILCLYPRISKKLIN